jgi:hypothetical protein
VDTNGGQVINYFSRFLLTGMMGSFPENAVTGLASVTDTEGPPTQNDVGNAAGSGEMGNFAIAWSIQMGLTKYTAMQTHPPTKITKKTKTPLYPTSPYTLATTFLGRPTIQTTVTEPVTWSFS